MLDACAALQPSLLLHQGVCPERSQQLALSRICLGPDGEGDPVSAVRFEGEHKCFSASTVSVYLRQCYQLLGQGVIA